MFWNKQSKWSKAVLGLILLDFKHRIQPAVYNMHLGYLLWCSGFVVTLWRIVLALTDGPVFPSGPGLPGLPVIPCNWHKERGVRHTNQSIPPIIYSIPVDANFLTLDPGIPGSPLRPGSPVAPLGPTTPGPPRSPGAPCYRDQKELHHLPLLKYDI